MAKRKKPHKDFPLFAHNTGRWCKKIRGKHHYFGPLHDPAGALAKYRREAPYLHGGLPVPPEDPKAGLRYACYAFLDNREARLNAGELSQRSLEEYRYICQRVVEVMGDATLSDLGPSDFASLRGELAKRLGPKSLGKYVRVIKSIFRHAESSGLVSHVDFGAEFRPPPARAVRIARKPKFLPARRVRKILKYLDGNGSSQMYAMTLLGINCGLGNTDCALLERRHLDLGGGWLDYPRRKTGEGRVAKLWPETIEALRGSGPRGEDLWFVTKYGNCWSSTKSRDCAISKEFGKALKALGFADKWLGFYALRHTFQTVGDGSGESIAVKSIMGHTDHSMSGTYREFVYEANLERVAEHVRRWLFRGLPLWKP